jgi:hypothetical protein
VPKLTREDRLSYFRRCIGNLPLWEYFTTAEMARKAGVPYDNKAREALKLLHEQGEVDMFEGKTRRGTTSYRWGRYRTTAEEAEAKAKTLARIESSKARRAAELAEESMCRFVECEDTAPAGQRYCPPHQEAMERYEREPGWWYEELRRRPVPPRGSHPWVFPSDRPDPFDGVPPDNLNA